MSARRSQVAVAWFTMGSENKAEVRLALSNNAGLSFGSPMIVDDKAPLGRVDVTHLTDGSLLVVWLGQTGETGQLFARRLLADGSVSEVATVGPMQRSRRSGFPQVAAIAGGAVVAWTDPASGVRLAHVSLR